MGDKKKTLTTGFGMPVDNDLNSMTAGPKGPVLMQDMHLLDKLAHFDRERIPERVVHAKGAGAHGYFEVTHNVTKYTRAKFLSKAGKKTEVFARFSTVGGERGSADSERDPRGFALKFYTEEGNYDMVGNNTPRVLHPRPVEVPRLYTYPETKSGHQPERCGYVLGFSFTDSRIHPSGYHSLFRPRHAP